MSEIPLRARLLAVVSPWFTRPGPHRFVYRLTRGWLGHAVPGMPVRMLLLTTRGRRSGSERTIPLMYFRIDGQLAVAGTNNAADRDPAWILNLRADPRVEVQVGSRRFSTRAREAGDEERERIWERMKVLHPLFALYEQRTRRTIPVVVLDEPDGPMAADPAESAD